MSELKQIISYDDDNKKDNDFSSYGALGQLMKNSSENPSINKVEFPNMYNINMEDKPKRGRPKKVIKEGTEKELSKSVKTPLNSDMPYFSTYNIPLQVLTQSAMQIDSLTNNVQEDLQAVRNAKTMRSKYQYISLLSGALSGLINNKIAIAKEMSNLITNSHKLDLAKHKEFNLANDQDDDKKIMDYFSALMNSPTGNLPMGVMPVAPQNINTTNPSGVPIGIADNGSAAVINDEDAGYNSYLAHLTPQQNAMLQSTNPNVETVMVYDQKNHNKWFEVIDTVTGEQVPNMEIPPDFVRDGCNIDIRNGIARNAQLNRTYKLKLVGPRIADEF